MKKRFLSVVALIIVICISIVSLVACNSTEQYFVFGTFLEVSVKGTPAQKISDSIYSMMNGYESILSPTIDGSDVYKINTAAVGVAVKCNAVTIDVARVAKEVYELSSGAYDPSVYPLVKLWGFDGGTLIVGGQTKEPPSQESIDVAKSLVGYTRVFTINEEEQTITKNIDGAMLDFGGIAKGYAVGTALDYADGKKLLVNLGGNIGCCNGEYTIGISSPRESDSSIFGKLPLSYGSTISTSGDYQRYYTYEGKRYHHVLNPLTGYPSDNGIISASVISGDTNKLNEGCHGALCDAVSTAVMVLGKENGKKLLEDIGLKAVLIYSDLTCEVVGDLNFEKV